MSDHSASHDPHVARDIGIRAYQAADFDPLVGLIGAAFGGETPDSVRFALTAPNTATFVAEQDGHVAGVAMAILFGPSAWIGNVVVAQDSRRRGLGTALTEAAVAAARERAETVLLLALGDAQRIYARLGFEPDGLYGTWRATDATAERVAAGRAPVAGLRLAPAAAEPAVTEQGLALDRWATVRTGGPTWSCLRALDAGRLAARPRQRRHGRRLQHAHGLGHRRRCRRRSRGGPRRAVRPAARRAGTRLEFPTQTRPACVWPPSSASSGSRRTCACASARPSPAFSRRASSRRSRRPSASRRTPAAGSRRSARASRR